MTPPHKSVIRSYYWLAVLDRNPAINGHLLLFPGQHFNRISDLYQEELEGLQRAYRLVKVYLDGHFSPDGYDVGVHNSDPALQHLYLHVIPRYQGMNRESQPRLEGLLPLSTFGLDPV